MAFFKKSEFKYIIYSFLFAIAYFVVLLPILLRVGIEKLNPILQFIVFNLGIFIFLQIFCKSIALKKMQRFRTSLGLTILFIALDLLVPPFAVNFSGQLLGNVGDSSNLILVGSSSDYTLGYILHSTGLSGFLVFFGVYVIIPLILMLISSLLLPDFVKEL